MVRSAEKEARDQALRSRDGGLKSWKAGKDCAGGYGMALRFAF